MPQDNAETNRILELSLQHAADSTKVTHALLENNVEAHVRTHKLIGDIQEGLQAPFQLVLEGLQTLGRTIDERLQELAMELKVPEVEPQEDKGPERHTELTSHLKELATELQDIKRVLMEPKEEISLTEIEDTLRNIEKLMDTGPLAASFKQSISDVTDGIAALAEVTKTNKIDLGEVITGLGRLETYLVAIAEKELPTEDGRLLIKLSDDDIQAIRSAYRNNNDKTVVYGGSSVATIVNLAGHGINPATEETMQSILLAVAGVVHSGVKERVSSTITYWGFSVPGTATSAAGWQIFKLDKTSGLTIKYAGGGAYNQIWDNRASLPYA